MIIQAELKCKQTGCEADPCAVDKVIELPSPRFQQFSRALLADYDFIAEFQSTHPSRGATQKRGAQQILSMKEEEKT